MITIHIKNKIIFFIFCYVLFTITKQDTKIIILSYILLLNTILYLFYFISYLSYIEDNNQTWDNINFLKEKEGKKKEYIL